jgi:hypothetical protein
MAASSHTDVAESADSVPIHTDKETGLLRSTTSDELSRAQPGNDHLSDEKVTSGNDMEKNGGAEVAPTVPPALSPAPDGGFEAWLVVTGAFCVLFVSFGWINCKRSGIESRVEMRKALISVFFSFKVLEYFKTTTRLTN